MATTNDPRTFAPHPMLGVILATLAALVTAVAIGVVIDHANDGGSPTAGAASAAAASETLSPTQTESNRLTGVADWYRESGVGARPPAAVTVEPTEIYEVRDLGPAAVAAAPGNSTLAYRLKKEAIMSDLHETVDLSRPDTVSGFNGVPTVVSVQADPEAAAADIWERPGSAFDPPYRRTNPVAVATEPTPGEPVVALRAAGAVPGDDPSPGTFVPPAPEPPPTSTDWKERVR